MDDAAALKRLQLLLKEKDALKIINHFHACSPDALVTDQTIIAAGPDSPLTKACQAYAKEHGHAAGLPGGYTSVDHYMLHDVKRLEQNANKRETYTAYADDELGTQCSGLPSALLARLTEHERN